MKKTLKLIIVILAATFIIWLLQYEDKTPLIAKNLMNVNEEYNNLFVFVGEKLDVIELPGEQGSMDESFKVKYKVLQRVYGTYPQDTIEFLAYDHYGIPQFSKYENALLFVTEYKGKFYHEKYQYFDVYKTKNNRWAGSYATQDYGHPYNRNTTVKPEHIDFVNEVSYPTIIKDSDGNDNKMYYPEPYYKIVGEKAIAVYGNYIEELFKLKKEGFLTARELFGDKYKKDREIEEKETQLAEEKITYGQNGLEFINFWISFSQSILRHDIPAFKKRSLANLLICDSITAVDIFTKRRFTKLFDSTFISKLIEGHDIKYGWVEVDNLDIALPIKGEMIKEENMYIFRQVRMDIVDKKNIFCRLYLDFIKTKNGYKFYGCSFFGNGQCCR